MARFLQISETCRFDLVCSRCVLSCEETPTTVNVLDDTVVPTCQPVRGLMTTVPDHDGLFHGLFCGQHCKATRTRKYRNYRAKPLGHKRYSMLSFSGKSMLRGVDCAVGAENAMKCLVPPSSHHVTPRPAVTPLERISDHAWGPGR